MTAAAPGPDPPRSRRSAGDQGARLPGGLSRADARRLLLARAPLALIPGWVWPAVGGLVLAILALAGQWPAALAGLFVGGGIALATLPRGRPAYGVAVDARTQPALHALVTDTAAALGQRPPDAVWLVALANAMVAHRPRRGARAERVDVILGLPLVEVLDAAALRAVVAHELAHVRDTDRLVDTLLAVRARLVADVDGRGTPVRPAERPFLDRTRSLAYQVELDSDAAAVRVVGPAATARGLRGTQRVAVLFDGYWSTVIAPLVGVGLLPGDFYAGWQRWWQLPDALRAASVAETELGAGDPATATHPNLTHRLAVLDALPSAPVPDEPADGSLAGTVALADPDGVRTAMLAQLPRIRGRRDRGPDSAVAVVPFALIPPHAYDPSLRASARDLLHAARRLDPAAGDVRGVLRLVEQGGGVRLAERVNPALLGESGAVRQLSTDRTLRQGLAALVCAELRERGWTWRDPLTRFVLYPPAGAQAGGGVDVQVLVAAFLDGSAEPWSRRRLHELMGATDA